MQLAWTCPSCWKIPTTEVSCTPKSPRVVLNQHFLCKNCGCHTHRTPTRNKKTETKKFLIINGAFCSNKGTIGDGLAKMHDIIHINGTSLMDEKKKMYPTTSYNDIHVDILWEAHKYLSLWYQVIVSQTILPAFWVLYEEYFKLYNIEADMILLTPGIEQIYKKNDLCEHLFDDEELVDMHSLLINEPQRKKFHYTTESSINQITQELYYYYLHPPANYYPQVDNRNITTQEYTDCVISQSEHPLYYANIWQTP